MSSLRKDPENTGNHFVPFALLSNPAISSDLRMNISPEVPPQPEKPAWATAKRLVFRGISSQLAETKQIAQTFWLAMVGKDPRPHSYGRRVPSNFKNTAAGPELIFGKHPWPPPSPPCPGQSAGKTSYTGVLAIARAAVSRAPARLPPTQ